MPLSIPLVLTLYPSFRCSCTVRLNKSQLYVVKGTVRNCNPIHFLSNSAKCSSCSPSRPFSVCAQNNSGVRKQSWLCKSETNIVGPRLKQSQPINTEGRSIILLLLSSNVNNLSQNRNRIADCTLKYTSQYVNSSHSCATYHHIYL